MVTGVVWVQRRGWGLGEQVEEVGARAAESGPSQDPVFGALWCSAASALRSGYTGQDSVMMLSIRTVPKRSNTVEQLVKLLLTDAGQPAPELGFETTFRCRGALQPINASRSESNQPSLPTGNHR